MKPAVASSLSILIYHRVLARPDPLFPGEVDARRFAQHLRLLKRFYTVLPLSHAVQGLQDGSLPPRAACISFDDGYADNAQLALPLLQQYGLHATFFIASDYLDGGQMWNDRLIDCVRQASGDAIDLRRLNPELNLDLGRLPIASLAQRRAAIGKLLSQLKYLPFGQRQHLADAIARLIPVRPDHSALMLSTAQLRQLQHAGMAIGAHTARHPILANLSDDAAAQEIVQGRSALEQLLQAPVDLFAYPNGKFGQDYGARDAALVRTLGFKAALATDPGAARPGDDPYRLPRFTPWRPGAPGFLWQLWQNRRR
ncbi:polysaccharide deacetylase family protein [Janthinobacterium aquaticum]|uniref:polysaccharide deacetylase family protein n=1 Tax=Janthinobacterium sp. FT58W TaxID=2654254 RepID=UPI00126597BB|nr:polysaccharide deacetylase family protein [Janthinobacterium sp. FT58W]KAB8041587.1 polysaccharide deacetylase family protein [Janthinobacterium sp. FT58W]